MVELTGNSCGSKASSRSDMGARAAKSRGRQRERGSRTLCPVFYTSAVLTQLQRDVEVWGSCQASAVRVGGSRIRAELCVSRDRQRGGSPNVPKSGNKKPPIPSHRQQGLPALCLG